MNCKSCATLHHNSLLLLITRSNRQGRLSVMQKSLWRHMAHAMTLSGQSCMHLSIGDLSGLILQPFHLILLTVSQELPKVIDGGQDPVPDEPQITEEEFDLSDIMGEQVDAQVDTKEERLRQLEKQVKTCAYSKSCWHCAIMHTAIAKAFYDSSISCCHGFTMNCITNHALIG